MMTLIKDCSLDVKIRINSPFCLVVAINFYDGAETGFAFFPSGLGIKFSSLGDSKSGRFRAYDLALIEGKWLRDIQKAMVATGAVELDGFYLISSQYKNIFDAIINRLNMAKMAKRYVGVSSP